jgi:hypothetical protein
MCCLRRYITSATSFRACSLPRPAPPTAGPGGWLTRGLAAGGESPGQANFFFLESKGGIEVTSCRIGYSGVQREILQSAVCCPGIRRRQ